MTEFFRFMMDFFKPWRRKIGCVTLILTLVFSAGWVRSFERFDRFSAVVFNYRFETFSVAGDIYWCHFGEKWSPPFFFFSEPFDTTQFRDREQMLQELSADKIEPLDTIDWFIPYWSIVVPLTALSAFLLLKKPNTSTQEKNSELVHVEGGGAS